MSANVIDLDRYLHAKQEMDEYARDYRALRDLMQLLFGPQEDIPEEAPPIAVRQVSGSPN